MDQSTRAWDRPELTVIVRGRPEEAILAACKVEGGDGPTNTFHRCQQPCSNPCSDPTGS